MSPFAYRTLNIAQVVPSHFCCLQCTQSIYWPLTHSIYNNQSLFTALSAYLHIYSILNIFTTLKIVTLGGAVTELVERGPRLREIRSSIPRRVKPMTYKIDTFRFLAWHSTLIWSDKDWFAEYQDNATEWDIRSWWCWPDFPVGQLYEVKNQYLSSLIWS